MHRANQPNERDLREIKRTTIATAKSTKTTAMTANKAKHSLVMIILVGRLVSGVALGAYNLRLQQREKQRHVWGLYRCGGTPQDPAEECNGIDDDCNGQTDENACLDGSCLPTQDGNNPPNQCFKTCNPDDASCQIGKDCPSCAVGTEESALFKNSARTVKTDTGARAKP